MFSLKKKSQGDSGILLRSPIAGEAVAISEVPDATFSEEFLGKGFAICPATGRVVAPFDGEVTLVFDTLHAITMTASSGIELLIHVGLETVGLKGKPFKAYVNTKDLVKEGTLLLEFDIEAIKAAGCDIITPIVITNSDEYKVVELIHSGAVKELDAVMKLV